MCAICNLTIEFSVDHPLSLSVAVETRRAIDAGLLPEPCRPDDSLADIRKRLKAIDSLKAAQQRLEQILRPEELLTLPDFFVLLIETGTWAFFHPTPTGFDPNCRPAPPNVSATDAAARDAVLVGSELVLGEIVAGRMPFETALDERVLALDADPKRYASLSDALSKTYPRVGFSRFVCA
jgi:hypothetical protein